MVRGQKNTVTSYVLRTYVRMGTGTDQTGAFGYELESRKSTERNDYYLFLFPTPRGMGEWEKVGEKQKEVPACLALLLLKSSCLCEKGTWQFFCIDLFLLSRLPFSPSQFFFFQGTSRSGEEKERKKKKKKASSGKRTQPASSYTHTMSLFSFSFSSRVFFCI